MFPRAHCRGDLRKRPIRRVDLGPLRPGGDALAPNVVGERDGTVPRMENPNGKALAFSTWLAAAILTYAHHWVSALIVLGVYMVIIIIADMQHPR